MSSSFKYILALVICIFLQSCNTYRTFYSETYTTTQANTSEKVLRLDLSNQNLQEIPEGIETLTHIKMLNLSGNEALDVAALLSIIPHPETLEVLKLNDLALETLPPTISRFTNLKQLSLNNNPDVTWDQAFQKIATLPIQFLDLQHNKLIVLPKEISEIRTLKDLNVSHNNITQGDTFLHLSKLPVLYSLWLSHNSLQRLAPEIGQLVQVNNLYIGHNQLESLPATMKTMKDVWVIQAEHNAFTNLPEVLIEMPNLFSVHLNNCKINHISEAFAIEKFSMKGLLLDNNNLSKVDKEKWKREFNNFFLLSIE